jgi:Acetyltransferases, including N-acetylases of ribosomal proteins
MPDENLKQIKAIIKALTEKERSFLGDRQFYDDAQYRQVYVIDEEPVGFIECRKLGKRSYLNFAVAPKSREKGIANNLIAKALIEIPIEFPDIEKIFWFSVEGNEASNHMAEKYGFLKNMVTDEGIKYVLNLQGGENMSYKSNDDVKVEKLAFLKADTSQRYTLGVVYSPLEIDSQGEFSDAAEIEKACWKFTKAIQGDAKLNKMALTLLDSITKTVKNGDPVRLDITEIWDDIEKGDGLGYMHESWDEGIGDIVENYIAPVALQIGNEKVSKGSWLMGIVWSPDYFAKVQKGEITGLSMGGKGRKLSVKEVI